MSVEKVKLTKVSATNRKKDGSECVTVKGQKFFKVGIQTEQHGEEYINGLIFADEVPFSEGEEVYLNIFEEEYDGATSKKFKTLTKDQEKDAKIKELEAKVSE